MTHEKYSEDLDFKHLKKLRNSLATVLTILTLVVYYGYIFLLAYGKSLMGIKVSANITIGLPIGVAVIVISWALTYYYAHWANTKYDHMVEDIKNKLGG